MRCEKIQQNIIEESLDRAAREHLAVCPQCQSFARETESLQAGFKLLAQDSAPEPSWGFAARVLRRLEESPAALFEPLESIGRRAVYAAGAVAMTVMMALALSSSGPVREENSGTFSLSHGENSETVETLLAGGVDENEEMNLLPVGMNEGDSR